MKPEIHMYKAEIEKGFDTTTQVHDRMKRTFKKRIRQKAKNTLRKGEDAE